MENASNDSHASPSEQRPEAGPPSWRQVLAGGLLSLLVLSTLAGNSLVCLAVLRARHLRAKVTNWFVLSLAVSDLCVALLVMPWKAVTEVAGGGWLFGARFCDTWVAFDIMCSTASIFHLCIISLDRYWAIASPFRYERRMTRGLASAMIALAWTLSLLISFVPVELHWHKAEERGSLDPPHRCDTRLNPTYAVTSSLISFYIPVSIMIGTYTQIYRIAQAQIRRISSLEKAGSLCSAQGKQPASSLRTSLCKETKVLQTLSIIVGVFVCCWFPFFFLNCLLPFCDSKPDSEGRLSGRGPCVSPAVFNVFMWLGWANSSVNPVIYAFNSDFRRAFSNLLGCCQHPCWLLNSSTVERVNLSNELASYHHNSSSHKSGGSGPLPSSSPVPAAWSQLLPHTVDFQGKEEMFDEPLLEKERLPLCPVIHRNDTTNINEPAMLPFGCELEVCLDTITPFTEVAGHQSGYKPIQDMANPHVS